MTQQKQKLTEIMSDMDTAMLVTRSAEGRLRSRPMAVARVDDDGDVWFLTRLASGKLDELREDERTHVVMQGGKTFLGLTGRAVISTDRKLLERLWSAGQKPWFPEGPETPDLAAIHVIGEEAEYWDRSGSEGVKLALEAARAVFEGRRLEGDPPSRHGHVQL